MGEHRLVLLPKQKDWDPAKGIPIYGIEHDIQYFDLQSLVRMYGGGVVKKYFRNRMCKWIFNNLVGRCCKD